MTVLLIRAGVNIFKSHKGKNYDSDVKNRTRCPLGEYENYCWIICCFQLCSEVGRDQYSRS